MIVVITGINGFSGRFLSEYIKFNNLCTELIGIDVNSQYTSTTAYRFYNLNEFKKLKDYLFSLDDEIRVFHLGGLTGNLSLSKLIEANVFWTAKYIELVSRLKNISCFINIGSSAEYGKQLKTQLSENLIPSPVTDYGISKHLQTQLVLNNAKADNFKIVCTRTFNLIGPGLNTNFVVGRMIDQFQKVKAELQSSIHLGRMDSIRNFIDVRDAVKIYWLLSEYGDNGQIYNVASDSSHEIREIFDILKKIFNFSPPLEQNRVVYKCDLDYQYADISKTIQKTGVKSFISLSGSIEEMVRNSLQSK